MYEVSRKIDFCYGHRLRDYEGKCCRLHGHNGKAIIKLEAGGLDHRGMVIDFSDIKRVVERWINETFDHRLLLRKDDPLIDLLREQDESVVVLEDNPTAENIAKLIAEYAIEQGFPVVEVQLWESPKCRATYRPKR